MRDTAISELVDAVECEIEAIKKRGGSNSIEVLGGPFAGQSDNKHLYVFPASKDSYVRDDCPIKIVVGEGASEGMAVAWGEDILTIASDRDFGPRIAHGRMVVGGACDAGPIRGSCCRRRS